MKDLTAALEAIQRGSLEEALETLLRVFRERRTVEVARLIETVSQRLPKQKPLKGKNARDKFLRIEEKQRAADVPSQLASEGAQSWRALASRPPDPRIAANFAWIVRQLPQRSPTAKLFYELVFGTLRTIADPRSPGALRDARPKLEQLGVPSFRVWMEAELDRTVLEIEAAAAAVPAATEEEQRAIQTLQQALATNAKTQARTSGELAALEAAIFEHPEDDGARMVFADALQEAGDPRGELIVLQLEATRSVPSAKARARVNAIIRAHRDRLLGEIAPWILAKGLVFERGFPARGRIRDGLYTSGGPPASPRWATFVELDVEDDPSAVNQLKGSLARSLEILHNAPYTTVPILETLARPTLLTKLGFRDTTAREALPKGRALERLVRLIEGGLAGRLRWVSLTRSAEDHGPFPAIPDALAARLDRLTYERWYEIDAAANLPLHNAVPLIEVDRERWIARFLAVPGQAGRALELELRPGFDDRHDLAPLENFLATLPSPPQGIRVTGAASEAVRALATQAG